MYDYALELSADKRFEEARAAVDAALRVDPEMAEAHDLFGELLARTLQLSEAEEEYRRAIRLKPDFARAHLDLAQVLADQGDIPGAVEHLRKAAQDPIRWQRGLLPGRCKDLAGEVGCAGGQSPVTKTTYQNQISSETSE